MAEEQAIDRVHRMGQTRPVTVTHYYVKESIEEVRECLASRNVPNLHFLISTVTCRTCTEKETQIDYQYYGNLGRYR